MSWRSIRPLLKKRFSPHPGKRLSLPWNRPSMAPSTPSRPAPGSKPICPWLGKGPGRGGPPRPSGPLSPHRSLDPPPLGSGFLVEKDQVKNILTDLKRFSTVVYQEKAVEELMLLYPRPGRPVGRRLPTGLRARTNRNEKQARQAIDGKLSTRWDSGVPQQPGMFFELDLGRTERVTGRVCWPEIPSEIILKSTG